MDEINTAIHNKLKEYAQRYFCAILEANTVNGVCNLAPGRYSAKEMQDNSHKSIFGHAYALPDDAAFRQEITITEGDFVCTFPYRHIFTILDRWEAATKVGRKTKAVFEIGGAEEKNAKVLLSERTITGGYVQKRVKLQRVCGNWWAPRKFQTNGNTALYYELNGVMFIPGLQASSRENALEKCPCYDDAKIIELLLSFLATAKDADKYGYFLAVAELAGISLDSKEAAQVMSEAQKEAESRRAEESRMLEESRIKYRQHLQEEEARIREEERRYKESQQRAKEKFISGKMVSLHEFEMIAELAGYRFNTRTLGTLRKRVSYIEVDSDGTPTVYGTKKKAGLDGTFDAIRKVYELAKAMPQEESEQSATPAETPQIPTGTAEASNAPAMGGKTAEAARKESKRTIQISLIVHHPAWIEKFAPDRLANVRKSTSTPTPAPPGYAPPIRGDCMISGSGR